MTGEKITNHFKKNILDTAPKNWSRLSCCKTNDKVIYDYNKCVRNTFMRTKSWGEDSSIKWMEYSIEWYVNINLYFNI